MVESPREREGFFPPPGRFVMRGWFLSLLHRAFCASGERMMKEREVFKETMAKSVNSIGFRDGTHAGFTAFSHPTRMHLPFPLCPCPPESPRRIWRLGIGFPPFGQMVKIAPTAWMMVWPDSRTANVLAHLVQPLPPRWSDADQRWKVKNAPRVPTSMIPRNHRLRRRPLRRHRGRAPALPMPLHEKVLVLRRGPPGCEKGKSRRLRSNDGSERNPTRDESGGSFEKCCPQHSAAGL